MIKNKKMFYTAVLLLVSSLILKLPFPDEGFLGESIATDLNIPARIYGVSYVGFASFFLLLASLFLLNNSIDKYNIRVILLAIMIAAFGPSILVDFYQKTFATDIYAVSYDSEISNCNFDRIDNKTLHGECKLPFKNNSSNDVKFSIEFYEKYEDELQMVTLMNYNGP